MSEPLATYLQDHLGGSSFAIELLQSLQDRYRGQPLGALAAELVGQVREDQQLLQRIADRVGESAFDLKVAAGWVAEKISRLKLQSGSSDELGTFETLETLTLGILGKASLWRTLAVVAKWDGRVGSEDFAGLAVRAKDQHDRVEAHRMEMIRRTFQLAE